LKIAGYTYGPLLGLYLTGLFSGIKPKESRVPVSCIAAAILTWLLNSYFNRVFPIRLWVYEYRGKCLTHDFISDYLQEVDSIAYIFWFFFRRTISRD
jgi:hypothetical protein